MEAGIDKFNREERDTMRQKLDTMDAEDAIASLAGELGALIPFINLEIQHDGKEC